MDEPSLIYSHFRPTLKKKDIDQSLERVIISSTFYDSTKIVKPKDEGAKRKTWSENLLKLIKDMDCFETGSFYYISIYIYIL